MSNLEETRTGLQEHKNSSSKTPEFYMHLREEN